VSDDSKRSCTQMTRRPSTKSLLSQMTMSTQTLRGEKPVKGVAGLYFETDQGWARFPVASGIAA
jgi:hypothetical protein